jgi:tetrahydromethanopterin S-methyltransferase subunit G
MTQHHVPRPAEGGDDSIAAVEAELDSTRHEMADTLDELAARLDVKTRGMEKAHEVKQRTQVAVRSRDVQIRSGIVAAIMLSMILMLVRRKRRRLSDAE